MKKRRIAGIAMGLCLAAMSSGATCQYILRGEIARMTGVQFHSRASKLSLSTGMFSARQISIRLPTQQGESLVQVDSLAGQILRGAFLSRKLDVPLMVMKGVHVSPELIAQSTPPRLKKDLDSDPMKQDWLPEQFFTPTDRQWMVASVRPELIECIQSVESKWRAELQSIDFQRESYEQRVQALQSSIKDVDNPLRDLDSLKKEYNEAKVLAGQLTAMRHRLNVSSEQFQSEIAGIDHAVELEQKSAFGQLMKLPLGTAEASEWILLGMIEQGLRQTEAWASIGTATHQLAKLKPKSSRGIHHVFSDLNTLPDWRVRQIKWQGDVLLEGQRHLLQGQVEGLEPASQPDFNPPTRSKLVSKNTMLETERIQTIHDMTDKIHLQTLLGTQEGWSVKNQQGFELTYRGNPIRARFEWAGNNDHWTCRVDLSQQMSSVQLRLPDRLGGDAASLAANQSLEEVRDWYLSAQSKDANDGTQHWHVESNLLSPLENVLQQLLAPSIAGLESEWQQMYSEKVLQQITPVISELTKELDQRLVSIDRLSQLVQNHQIQALAVIRAKTSEARFSRSATSNPTTVR